MRSEKLKRIKTIECMSCEHLIGCKGKPKDVDRCVNYEERKRDDARKSSL